MGQRWQDIADQNHKLLLEAARSESFTECTKTGESSRNNNAFHCQGDLKW